jgi:hypothetical protein
VENLPVRLQDLKQSIARIIRVTAIGAIFGTLPARDRHSPFILYVEKGR